jgi:hypothetical protein
MIFVSYSHANAQMCQDFVTMAAPLKRYVGVRLWSDDDIPPGKDLKKAIGEALDRTSVAVLLVSKEYLASDFVQTIELPYFLKAAKGRGVEFLWVLISDCLWTRTPLDPLKAANKVKHPIDQFSIADQQTAWRKVVEKVDEAWQRYERPKINAALSGKDMNRVEENLHVLAAPARRKTEVFVYSENAMRWWHVGSILPGQRHCTCYFGDDKTKSKSKFKILAITTDLWVGGQMKPPDDRTRSDHVIVRRR